jgi:CDP-glucose 4,6-dehydratase
MGEVGSPLGNVDLNLTSHRDFWSGRKVLITGHTGFKGAWLTHLLLELGAEVKGLSLPPEDERSIYSLTRPAIDEVEADIRDQSSLNRFIHSSDASVVFHLAAQSFVTKGFQDPCLTFETNVMGTANVLLAVAKLEHLEGVVVVTSDKVYAPDGERPFTEDDPLGGKDPYSASKAAAELVVASLRTALFDDKGIHIGTVRAGNVFGGGDRGPDRLIPDAVRAYESSMPLAVRNPGGIRPWQYVLDPLWGYLSFAVGLVQNHATPPSLNFGPDLEASDVSVERMLDHLQRIWGVELDVRLASSEMVETPVLRVDASKARTSLGWRPMVSLEEGLRLTVAWYKEADRSASEITRSQVSSYLQLPGTSS